MAFPFATFLSAKVPVIRFAFTETVSPVKKPEKLTVPICITADVLPSYTLLLAVIPLTVIALAVMSAEALA